MTNKVSPPQQKLLDALRAGDVCHYMRYTNRFNPVPYYFLASSFLRCTAQVNALLRRGLVEKYETSKFGNHKVRVSDAGKQS